jgi:ATP-dependent Clp protease ATP-binding subunit ClpA
VLEDDFGAERLTMPNGKIDENKSKVNPLSGSAGHGDGEIGLNDIAVNLTELARKKLLYDSFAWHDEIDKIIRLLSQSQNNNICIYGAKGTGKVATIKGLAYRLVKKNKYRKLPVSKKNIWMIDMKKIDFIDAKSDFEDTHEEIYDLLIRLARGKQFVQNSIIFFPQLVNNSGFGRSSWFFDMIQKVLLPSGIQYICNFDETPKDNNGVSRLFAHFLETSKNVSYVKHKGVTEKEVDRILNERIKAVTNYHQVSFSLDAIKAAKEYSRSVDNVYSKEGKINIYAASKILDLAAVQYKLSQDYNTAGIVCLEETMTVIERLKKEKQDGQEGWIFDNTAQNWTKIKQEVREKVKGQDEAVTRVLKRIQIGLSPFRFKGKPVASFMFAGTTGTGKTYLSQTVADALGMKLLRIDMSEFYQEHTIARFIGSPPGYIGPSSGQLTEWVKNNPKSFILLDEIDKAHPKIMDSLLQVLDAGRITSGGGKEFDMTGCIIAMTTNFGAEDMKKAGRPKTGFSDSGFNTSEQNENIEHLVKRALEKELRPEFINRFDDIIVFKQISSDVLDSLVRDKVKEIVQQAKKERITVKVLKPVMGILSILGFDRQYGVRPLQREVDELIRFKLANLSIEQDLKGKTVKILSNLTKRKIDKLVEEQTNSIGSWGLTDEVKNEFRGSIQAEVC